MLRTERFALVFSPAEKRTLERLAEAEGGLSQAAILRCLLRRAAREHGLWPPPADDQAHADRELIPDA